MKYLLFLSLFYSWHCTFPQQTNKNKPAEYYGLLRSANEKFDIGDFYDAIPDYENLLKQTPEDPQIQLKYGICIASSGKNKLKAIPSLKNAAKSGLYKAFFYLGKVYYTTMQFDSANFYFQSFKEKADKGEIKKTEVDNLINHMYDAMLLLNAPACAETEHLGKAINSPYAEYAPLITADNSTLYFTSRRNDTRGGNTDMNMQYFEDIYLSKNHEGQWNEAENAGTPLNSKEHDATVAISADGNLIIIYRTDPYLGDGDLYFSKRDGKSWSLPLKMGMNINSPQSETSASITMDQQTIYFSSNRSGGYGGIDIYKSIRGKNGVWGKAENLGPDVNTLYDEEAPFIHADGKTLYFSSKGHNINMGGYDVFKTSLGKNGKWKKPENMGLPVNTLEDDLYFTMTADGQTGYISSNRTDSEGDLDIYKFTFKNTATPLTLLKGTVSDEKESRPVKAEIYVIDRAKDNIVAKYLSNSETGEFLVVLPNDRDFKVVFEYGNRIFTEIIDTPEDQTYRILYKTIEIPTE